MAIELVTILEIEPDTLYVSARDRHHCGRCAARSGCGQQLLQTLPGDRTRALKLPRSVLPATGCLPGDTVELQLDDARIVGLSLLLYGLPVAAMTLVTALASVLAVSETWVMAVTLAALFITLAGIHRVGRSPLAGLYARPRTGTPGATITTTIDRNL